jgi:outer membrane protein, multidrug efflux system
LHFAAWRIATIDSPMRSLAGACLLGLWLGCSAEALAQLNSAPNQPPAPGSVSAPPELPEVSDPMLTPVGPPTNVLTSWRQAVELVRSRSTSLALARAEISRARGQSRLTRSAILPQLAGSGSVNRELLLGHVSGVTATGEAAEVTLPDPKTTWNASLSFNQPLVDTRAWYDLGTSAAVEKAATVQSEDTQRRAIAQLADAIVTVTTAERLAEVSRVSLRSNLSALDLTQRRARLGAASAVDVLRAEQEVVDTRGDVVQADEVLRRSRESLGIALGYAEDWGVTSDIKVDGLAADAQALCSPIAGADERSDVRAARLNVDVAERTAKSPNYGYAPTLDLISGVNYTTQEPTNNGRPVQWSVGAVLSVPIYDGGRLSAERYLNAANADSARQQLTEASRQAHLQVIQAQRGVEVAASNFEVSRNARAIAEESARLSRIAFMHGTGTSFDLVDSARRLRLAEIDLALKEFEVIRARITALLTLSNCKL